MVKSEEYIKARARAIKYILYKMRTSKEVYDKLISLGFSDDDVNMVIKDLKELDYINDVEYTKKFIESNKKTKKYSKSVLRLKLKSKGIPEELIDEYFYSLDVSDIDAVISLLKKKNFLKIVDFDEKNKIKLCCVRKGFSIGDVNKAIKIYEKGEEY